MSDHELASLSRDISPPPVRKTSVSSGQADHHDSVQKRRAYPSMAAVEAGLSRINDHLAYFSAEFARRQRPEPTGHPQLSTSDFKALYNRNLHSHGRHFVVHQHDHPVAGVHYDLRLQFSKTSCISFSIPYGLPGNPNSRRPHRLAIETRVHTLWNNLVESASHETGALLIWDTGEYEVLSRHGGRARDIETDNDDDEEDEESCCSQDGYKGNEAQGDSDSARLFRGFQKRYIKLRLGGKRLPPGYTISLHLPSANNIPKPDAQPARRKSRKRKRASDPNMEKSHVLRSTESSAEENSQNLEESNSAAVNSLADSDGEDAFQIKVQNAYPGSSNTIGSIHQRAWLITLDPRVCGFVRSSSKADGKKWLRPKREGCDLHGQFDGFEPFSVFGKDLERSIVTGRLAADVYNDEGVKAYRGRKMWQPITE